jgi:O-antigen/teichoic acid export membrane protein
MASENTAAPAPTEPPPGVFFSARTMGGVPWMLLSKLVLFAVYFGISVIAVRQLGAAKYGVYSLCKNLSEYLVVFCGLGLNAALIRFLPELELNHNRAGMIRLLRRAFALQAVAAVGCGVALQVALPLLNRAFGVSFGHLLWLTGVLVAAVVAKGFANDTLTALFRSRDVCILGIGQGLLWVALLYVGMRFRPEAGTVLAAQAVSFAAAAVVGFVLLVAHIRGLHWRSPPQGIGKARALRTALPIMGGSLIRMLMDKYTEVFFLGAFFSTQLVGIYDLGYSTPAIVIGLVPTAVQSLFLSGFAEAYTRDPNCLPRLVNACYKGLILIAVPLAAFGVFFAPQGIVLIYGESMRAAGPVASAFCVFHVLPLVSIPLSMAITAREKNLDMLPMLLLQVCLNLALDVALIPHFGMAGAVVAVYGTYALTIPLRLRTVRRLIGGIFFPTGFLLRIAIPSLILSAAPAFLANRLTLPALLGLGCAYLAVGAVCLRLFRLVHSEDLRDFRSLGIGRLNRVLDLVAGVPR